MTTNWNPLTKTTGTSYTAIAKPLTTFTTVGKAVGTTYTSVAKPTPTVSSVVSFTGGDPMGMLLALTYTVSTVTSVVTDGYTYLNKTAGTTYTLVPKAT